MGLAHRLQLAVGLQTFQRILADDGQHSQTHLTIFLLLLEEQTLLAQRRDLIKERLRPCSVGLADHLHGFQCPLTGKHRASSKEPLLPAREQRIAPLQGLAQRLLAGWSVYWPARQYPQWVLQ